VADFKHPCLKLWAFNFGHPCPSLVKGEVLSPTKIRATTGGIAFRRTEPLHSHNHCKRTTIPLPCTITLASTRKRVRFCCSVKPSNYGGDCFPSAPSMRFSALSLSLFVGERACPSRRTEPLHPHNHCKRTTTPLPAPTPLPLNERSVVLHPHQPSQKHIHPFAPHPSISHYSPSNIHFLPVYP